MFFYTIFFVGEIENWWICLIFGAVEEGKNREGLI